MCTFLNRLTNIDRGYKNYFSINNTAINKKKSKKVNFLIILVTSPTSWSKQKYSEVPEKFRESVSFDQQSALGTSLFV